LPRERHRLPSPPGLAQEDVLSFGKLIRDFTAVGIAAAFSAGTLTARQVTGACLDRIAVLNP
jgi:hypothetical protein